MKKSKTKEVLPDPTPRPGWVHSLFEGLIDELLERVKTTSEKAANLKKG